MVVRLNSSPSNHALVFPEAVQQRPPCPLPSESCLIRTKTLTSLRQLQGIKELCVKPSETKDKVYYFLLYHKNKPVVLVVL